MPTVRGEAMPVLDVRPEASFLQGHAAGAASIPLEELPGRVHELPPKGTAIALFDGDPDRRREAADLLRRRGYTVQDATPAIADLVERGPSPAVLWRPGVFLIESLARIESLAPPAARGRRALDLACGAGREAVYLALHGWQVDAVDVLPDALQRAADLAHRCGTQIRTIQQDLRRQPILPGGGHDLVAVFRFLHRPALPAIRQSVAAGGFVVYEAFHWSDRGRPTDGRLLADRSGSPSAGREAPAAPAPPVPRHAFLDGELPAAFNGFECLIARDGVQRDGRRFSQLLARRPT